MSICLFQKFPMVTSPNPVKKRMGGGGGRENGEGRGGGGWEEILAHPKCTMWRPLGCPMHSAFHFLAPGRIQRYGRSN
jgi:hypothetical protein